MSVFLRYVDLKQVSVTVKAYYGTGATEDISTSNQIAFASVSYRGANTRLVEHSGSLVLNLSESRMEQFDAKVGGTFQVRIENYLDTALTCAAGPHARPGWFASLRTSSSRSTPRRSSGDTRLPGEAGAERPWTSDEVDGHPDRIDGPDPISVHGLSNLSLHGPRATVIEQRTR